ncbi:MAG: class I SAM-dependent methyltransferase [Lachnospiraceae bacterium]|nr:class I SAM-dependent methyltransferase [Lachnospiraceae bacterium]MDD7178496.1 methyltransferase domain-containing protein [bacterium]MDY5516482.1 methyltransferase domain-containing protein [Lachnospiraceae bacterium]
MDAYTGFAEVYDRFMMDVPYEQWRDMIVNELKKASIEDGLLLDLGCGTGTLTRMLANAGYDMIGVDGSEEMLMEAREKEDGTDILYLCQDMRQFELYGTVRAVISTCDTMNYLLTPEDFIQTVRLVNNYLDPGGLFIFDLNTLYKFRELMGNTTIAESGEDASFIWDNFFDGETGRNEYDLTLFIKREDGLFERQIEVHEEQGYSLEEVKGFLEAGGMQFVRVFDADTGDEPTDTSEKVFFIAREKGK